MMIPSPIAPTPLAGASPAVATLPATAATAFTLTLQSMAPGSESILAAPLLAAGFTGEAPQAPVLSLLGASLPSEAAALSPPLAGTDIPVALPDAAPTTAKLVLLEAVQTKAAAPSALTNGGPPAAAVETPSQAAPTVDAIPDPKGIAKPVVTADAGPIANPTGKPPPADRLPVAQKAELAVEAEPAKPKLRAAAAASLQEAMPAVPSSPEMLVSPQSQPAIVLAAIVDEPARTDIELPSEVIALDAEQLPTEGLIAPSAPLPAQPAAQPQKTSGEAATAPAVASASQRLPGASAIAETNMFAPVPSVTAAATPSDAAIFSIALDGPPPQAANDTQGLPSQLLGQTLAPAASRPLSPQHIYPTQPTPLPGTVTAQPGRIGREMGVEIARRVSGGQDEMLIRLNPQEMGRIEVRLSFDESGAVRAVLASESLAALEMLRRDTGDLARSLADAGVRSDAQSFRFDRSGGDGAGQRGHGGGNPQHGRQANGLAGQGGADDEQSPPAYRQLRSSGQVNLIA